MQTYFHECEPTPIDLPKCCGNVDPKRNLRDESTVLWWESSLSMVRRPELSYQKQEETLVSLGDEKASTQAIGFKWVSLTVPGDTWRDVSGRCGS